MKNATTAITGSGPFGAFAKTVAACAIVLAGCLSTAGCGREGKADSRPKDVLVTVGDSSLTMQQVLARIPSGITPEDSAAMFGRIVDRWVRIMVLSDVAERNIPDLARIDEMVENYRNDLIVNTYLQKMDVKGATAVAEDAVEKYYADRKEELVLEAPLIKGIFLKVPENDEMLPQIRQWMASADGDAVDNLEKQGLRQASQYEYFTERWADWQSVAEQIPYRFFDADAFVTSTRDFETSYGGSVYLLHISDYIESGNPMPYEYARARIVEILRNTQISDYRRNLIRDLLRREVNEGRLKSGLYDPVAGRMKESQQKKQKQD